jgi:hypothetical protein
MRFLADGPSIPDDLLIARDAGDVIFFCGAGVSRHRAGLPDLLKLGGDVIDLLGAGEKSLARKVFQRIREIGPMDGVGGLVATDRVFRPLEREFEQKDVQTAVARAICPAAKADLSAHRTLIDLSRGRDGTVRLVTTNFDLLFEQCVDDITCSGRRICPIRAAHPSKGSFTFMAASMPTTPAQATRSSSSRAQILATPICRMVGRRGLCSRCLPASRSCLSATPPTIRPSNTCSRHSTCTPVIVVGCSHSNLATTSMTRRSGSIAASVRSRSTTVRVSILSGTVRCVGRARATWTAGTPICSRPPPPAPPYSIHTFAGRSLTSFQRAKGLGASASPIRHCRFVAARS